MIPRDVTAEPPLPVDVCGAALLKDAVLNKGTAFTDRERHELGLEGLLPPAVETLDQQVARVRLEYDTQPTRRRHRRPSSKRA